MYDVNTLFVLALLIIVNYEIDIFTIGYNVEINELNEYVELA